MILHALAGRSRFSSMVDNTNVIMLVVAVGVLEGISGVLFFKIEDARLRAEDVAAPVAERRRFGWLPPPPASTRLPLFHPMD